MSPTPLLPPGHQYSTKSGPIALTSGFGCRTNLNFELYNIFLIFVIYFVYIFWGRAGFLYPMISRMSRDFNNFYSYYGKKIGVTSVLVFRKLRGLTKSWCWSIACFTLDNVASVSKLPLLLIEGLRDECKRVLSVSLFNCI